ncbi:alpha/beta hydrolase [Luteibacter sp. dw_328]|uniref:alpha/beta hydrolase n=1 Tax=Luteibacter sp. dw_328 TaxID=2719796 RepID=UPI001BD418AA|nr:alpha/beta hydrolase [Luteibacter sp. dw_328]
MTVRHWAKQHRLRLAWIGFACLVAYFLTPVLILVFMLDQWVLSPSRSEATHEQWRHVVTTNQGRGVALRRYSNGLDGKCAIFFPGQHGGMARYERDLLPLIRVDGVALYTISYPGQDGAPGQGSLKHLSEDVERTLRFLADDGLCTMAQSLFVGRSLGASIAVVEAAKLRPKGVLVEGVSPDLATAIRAWMRRHIATWAWQSLPIRALVPMAGELEPAVSRWQGPPMIVFQGTDDKVAPFDAANAIMLNRPGVRFEAVPGGNHEDTFLIAGPAYRAALLDLLDR